MAEFFESSSNVSGLIMAVIFAIAGFKLWQQSREEKAKKE